MRGLARTGAVSFATNVHVLNEHSNRGKRSIGIDLTKPGQGFIRAAGSLGWGLPAALGAKLAQPDRPVLLFSGDGGFWYHLSELETAVRWNIAAVLLINNNKSLNQEIDIYTRAYGGQLRANHAELWQFSDVSFAEVARAMGAEGIQVHKPGELAGALNKAFSADGTKLPDSAEQRIEGWILDDGIADPGGSILALNLGRSGQRECRSDHERGRGENHSPHRLSNTP